MILQFNLQLPVQSVPITTKVVSLNFEPGLWQGVLDITLCDKVCQ